MQHYHDIRYSTPNDHGTVRFVRQTAEIRPYKMTMGGVTRVLRKRFSDPEIEVVSIEYMIYGRI